MKISSLIIALVIVATIATTFSMSILNLSEKHSVTYDNETLAVFQNADEIHSLAVELENKTNSQNTESGIVDIVGSYISRALDALKLSAKSFNVFSNMASSATEKVGLPNFFYQALLTIVLILIVIGVIISAMVKRDL